MKIIKKELSVKAKRIITVFAVIFLSACFIGGALIYNNSKKEFESSTKNAISMGTVITSKVYGSNAAIKNEEIISVIQQLDETISWRIDGSAVSDVNSGKSVKLNELASIIAKCNDVSKNSDGAFDITIGNVSSLWDFGGDNERLPSEKEIKTAIKTVDFSKVNYKNGVVSVEKGQKLDLGAIGKGYACDMIKSYLEMTNAEGAVVSVGGSILAYGKRNKAGDPWRVAVKHPRRENSFLGTISLDEGFVSTSGDYEKYFEQNGKRYHHILDARNGYPAESDLISVTIVTDNGLLSDALSTACFILGSEKGKVLCGQYGAKAVFVDKDENVTVIGELDFEKSK